MSYKDPAFYWEDEHLAELIRSADGALGPKKTFREMVVDEVVWWLKCSCVIGLVALAAYFVGWGLAVLS